MRIVFAGTPSFVVPILVGLDSARLPVERLLARRAQASGQAGGGAAEIVLVVTQPDRPAGRGHRLTPPPVKLEALRRRLAVEQPEDVNAPAFIGRLRGLEPDLMVLAAFGQILSGELLRVPRFGVLNVHFSLLPKYRGAAPAARAILRGEKETGVTLLKMTGAVDAGPIVCRRSVAILPAETAGELQERLGEMAAEIAGEEPAAAGGEAAGRAMSGGAGARGRT